MDCVTESQVDQRRHGDMIAGSIAKEAPPGVRILRTSPEARRSRLSSLDRVALTGLRPSGLPPHRTCGFPHPAVGFQHGLSS